MGETGDPFYKTYQLDPGTSLPLTIAIVPGDLPNIVSSTPASGSIDARQETDFDGLNPAGWNSVQLDLDDDASGLVAGDFSISLSPAGVAPSVSGVVPSGNSVTVQFDSIIPAGSWTVITMNGQSVCLASLPGDVDASLASNASDILRIIDCLNGIETCAVHQGDVNRSGDSNSQDIIRLIDLLNGVAPFANGVWNGSALPASPCAP
jgi:hypothetical protein